MIAVHAVAPAALLAVLAFWSSTISSPVLLALAAVVASQVALLLTWFRDLDQLAVVLQRSAHVGQPISVPRFQGTADLIRRIEQATCALLARAECAEAAWRAEIAVAEALPEPLLVLGADHQLRRANAAARREFGAEAAALLRHPTLRAALDRAQPGDMAQTIELVLPVPVPREWAVTITALDHASGSVDRFVVVLADRTRAHAVERMRADFVANASHELRTPLASLIGFIETLRGPAADDPAAAERFLGVMAEQAARMERLIADLLSLARIEVNEHQRPLNPVDLANLVGRVVAGLEPQITARKAELQLDLAAALPRMPGDADQLAQVLRNLLDNALRHGRDGGTVRLSACRANPGVRWPHRPGLVLSVADDGPGIPRQHIPRLTERFYRVDRGRSRAAGGTGLGLAIVKHVVNRHRGQLRIESREGEGATFSVWLPLD